MKATEENVMADNPKQTLKARSMSFYVIQGAALLAFIQSFTLAHAAMAGCYATLCRDKKGFRVSATDNRGDPVYVSGASGSLEWTAALSPWKVPPQHIVGPPNIEAGQINFPLLYGLL